MKIKKLVPMEAESQRLIDWMEKGVYDALQKKDLETLLFWACEAIEGPMVEGYPFSFSDSNSESREVSMNVNRICNKKQGMTFKCNSTTEITPNQTRSSACKLVRTRQLMQTLDIMPEKPEKLISRITVEDGPLQMLPKTPTVTIGSGSNVAYGSPIQIFVKTLEGSTLSVSLRGSCSVSDLIDEVERRTQRPVGKLTCSGKLIREDDLVGEINSTVFETYSLKGGVKLPWKILKKNFSNFTDWRAFDALENRVWKLESNVPTSKNELEALKERVTVNEKDIRKNSLDIKVSNLNSLIDRGGNLLIGVIIGIFIKKSVEKEPKPEGSNLEGPKPESPKPEGPRSEGPKTEDPKLEASKTEPNKEDPKPKGPIIEVSKPEPKKEDPKKESKLEKPKKEPNKEEDPNIESKLEKPKKKKEDP